SVKHYLYSLSILQNIRYKVQSRKRVNDIVKQGLITVERIEGSIRAGIKSDIHVWRWVWFCSGDGGCQRSCSGF
ncbi:35058_t:CDS:2, partial [Gigaspora margarita]